MELESSKSTRTKIIKRYQNRKLYDTQQSCYVTLEDISKMVRSNEEVMVIDNKTKNDITASTLTQIIFEAEKKAVQHAPLFTLREIIQFGNGSISGYLCKLGAFSQELLSKPVVAGLSQNFVLDNVNLTIAPVTGASGQGAHSKNVAEKATSSNNEEFSDVLLPGSKLL